MGSWKQWLNEKKVILSLLAAVRFLTLRWRVEMQAVIRIGHNSLPTLEVCTQNKWIAIHPGDYGSGLHSNLEHNWKIYDHTIGGEIINVNTVLSRRQPLLSQYKDLTCYLKEVLFSSTGHTFCCIVLV